MAALIAAGAIACCSALAQEGKTHSFAKKTIAAHEKPFGREGDPKKATRTIRIEINDALRFFPSEIKVKRGQTVRFVVRNGGHVPHQFVLGTHEGLKKEAERMKEAIGVEPLGLYVMPGETARLVWHFTRAGEFHYGCLLPAHYQAGAIGTIIVR